MNTLEEEKAYYRTVKELLGTDEGSMAEYHFGLLNAKISALLTHVSLMVAVAVGIFAVDYSHHDYTLDMGDRFILCEVVGYIVITLLCLRGIFITDPNLTRNKQLDIVVDKFCEEAYKRRILYTWAVHLTIYLSVIFIATLLWKFLLHG